MTQPDHHPYKREKPWGHELWWGQHSGKYLGKLIYIKSGEQLSLHYHERKEETMYVHKGIMEITVYPTIKDGGEFRSTMGKSYNMHPGETIHIPPYIPHTMEAVSGDVEMFEVSTCEMEDSIRLQDYYGRDVP